MQKVIREVLYPVWLANIVLVKKKNGKYRMCVDFTDLNKAFKVVEKTRVRMEDEEKTSFITPFGTFCFVRMPEGLKNAGCTFSRMIAIVLHPQLQRNILAYVNDIVVKSIQRRDHISDLAETFVNLRAANLKMNLRFRHSQGENPGVLGFDKGY
jgi:hypothetical protein